MAGCGVGGGVAAASSAGCPQAGTPGDALMPSTWDEPGSAGVSCRVESIRAQVEAPASSRRAKGRPTVSVYTFGQHPGRLAQAATASLGLVSHRAQCVRLYQESQARLSRQTTASALKRSHVPSSTPRQPESAWRGVLKACCKHVQVTFYE